LLLVKSVKRMRLFREPPDPILPPPPLVTIIVPAKDEEQRISLCVESILKQDYGTFNVIAVDDRSSDQTGAILDQFAARDGRMKVIHLHDGDLPPRWTGKNHALHVASGQAEGQWLLFVDADVILYPQALRIALGTAMFRRYDLISLMP
jgi:glycosyltransferase involved in cell wall biosynthesis